MAESPLLHFLKHQAHDMALLWMVTVYVFRLIWFMRFPPMSDRQARTGHGNTTPAHGAKMSLLNVTLPWTMESSRRNIGFWVQFVIFHIGAVSCIFLAVTFSYFPVILTYSTVVFLFQVVIGGAFVVGVIRIARRISDPQLMAISTPDDYFAISLLTIWLFFGFISAPNNLGVGEWQQLTYFILTVFFLFYVPFSKISHYLYYPFNRWYLGRTLGYRGVFPLEQNVQDDEKLSQLIRNVNQGLTNAEK